MLSRCDETSPRSIKKYQEGVAIPFQDAPDISGQHMAIDRFGNVYKFMHISSLRTY